MASSSAAPKASGGVILTDRRFDGQQILDRFRETEYREQDRPQARLAFETAAHLRRQQERFLAEQIWMLDRANVFGRAAADLEQFIIAQELLISDLRSRCTPSYGIPPPTEVEEYQIRMKMPSATPRFAIPPIESVLAAQSEHDRVTAVQSAPTSTAVECPGCIQAGLSTLTEVSGGTLSAFDIGAVPFVPKSQQQPAANKPTGFDSVGPTGDSQRKSVAWNERTVMKKVLGRQPLPYPPNLTTTRFLPDGNPSFTFVEVFGQLPEQIEVVLEMDTSNRVGVPTRFIIDPTLEYNFIQFKTVDEVIGKGSRDGVIPRPVKEMFISWSSKRAVKLEWFIERLRIRRWSPDNAERKQALALTLSASVTNSRGLPVNVQVLGAPFAHKFVKGFVMFGSDEGAIAVLQGAGVDWWPFRSTAGRL